MTFSFYFGIVFTKFFSFIKKIFKKQIFFFGGGSNRLLIIQELGRQLNLNMLKIIFRSNSEFRSLIVGSVTHTFKPVSHPLYVRKYSSVISRGERIVFKLFQIQIYVAWMIKN